jgi:SAM-dependent methyltransferase
MLKKLRELYLQQQAIKPDGYLETHFRFTNSIKNRINCFRMYESYIGKDVLDWGCRHAIDACLVRMTKSGVNIFGCDFCKEEDYKVFYDFAKVSFQELTHHYRLPYADASFDTVIGGGVFEHVPFDDLTIQELWRIIRTDGYLILTYLPNLFSYTEMSHRLLRMPHHKKRFTHSRIRNYLLHNGFIPIKIKYNQMIPTQLGFFSINKYALVRKIVEVMWVSNYILEKLWPINKLSTNFVVIAKRVDTIP